MNIKNTSFWVHRKIYFSELLGEKLNENDQSPFSLLVSLQWGSCSQVQAKSEDVRGMRAGLRG